MALLGLLWSHATPARAWPFSLELERRLTQLSSGTPEQRVSAAAWLGRRGDAHSAVRALIPVVERDPVSDVRRVAALSLARRRDPAAIPALSATVAGADASEQRARARALAAIEHDGARAALVLMIGATSAGELATELASEASPAIVPFLIGRLSDPSASAQVARALAAQADPAAAAPALSLCQAPEPALRASALTLLGSLAEAGALGEVDPLPAIRAALAAPQSEVALAARLALGRAGAAADAALLDVPPSADEPQELLRARLEALCRLDPVRAHAALESLWDAQAQPWHRAAVASALLALAAPASTLSPLLVTLALATDRPAAERLGALDALGAMGSLDALLSICEAEGAPDAAALTLALTLRAQGDVPQRTRALSRLAQVPQRDRRLALRALAGDTRIEAELLELVGDPSPVSRELAARASSWVGPLRDAHVEALRARLRVERDPGVAEAILRSLGAAGARPAAPLSPTLGALWLLADALVPPTELPPRLRRRHRQRAYEALRSADPHARALALEVLGQERESRSQHALAASLEDARHEVRHAAARALARLGAEPARDALRSRLAVEPDAMVRRALRDALQEQGAPAAERRAALVVRLELPAPRPDGVDVDVVLPDGRWLRVRAWSSGELVVPDLPVSAATSVDADVRPRP